MENKLYSNLPIQQTTQDSADPTKKYFDQYFNAPVDIDNNFTISIKSFFEKRGFSTSSAESIALVILTQAKKDNFNPQQIIDSLSGLTNLEISGLVAEILNYNRFKTSSLGIYIAPSAADEIQRNILA
jgi:hypothetical protein